VAAGDAPMKLSAQNLLAGTVARLVRGAVSAEVVIQLPGGATICAIVSNDSVDAMQLGEGQPATAIINASHVILGVPASYQETP